jgi:hypothetical protein
LGFRDYKKVENIAVTDVIRVQYSHKTDQKQTYLFSYQIKFWHQKEDKRRRRLPQDSETAKHQRKIADIPSSHEKQTRQQDRRQPHHRLAHIIVSWT